MSAERKAANDGGRSWAVLILVSALLGLYRTVDLLVRCLLLGLLVGTFAGGAYLAFRIVLARAGL